jgi:hypothetical protein
MAHVSGPHRSPAPAPVRTPAGAGPARPRGRRGQRPPHRLDGRDPARAARRRGRHAVAHRAAARRPCVRRDDGRPAGAAQERQHDVPLRPLLFGRPRLPRGGVADVAAATARSRRRGPHAHRARQRRRPAVQLRHVARASARPPQGELRALVAAMSLHVLGHLRDTARLAPLDWYGRSRSQVTGAGLRQRILAATPAVGVPLGSLVVGRAASFFLRGLGVAATGATVPLHRPRVGPPGGDGPSQPPAASRRSTS